MLKGNWPLFFLGLLMTAAVQTQSINDIECPFPGGSDPSNSEECGKYTACIFDSVCHMKQNNEVGYKVLSAPVTNGRGFTVQLSRISTANSLFEFDIPNLTFEAIFHEDYHLQIKIYDADNSRFEVPVPLNLPTSAGSTPLYEITTSNVGSPFTFTVNRISNGNAIFKSAGPLTFEDQFIQLTTQLASEDMYGFGESTHVDLKRQFSPRSTYALWARDQPVGPGEVNEYGVHPYYQLIEDAEGNSHSVLFFNSNAQEYSTFLMNGNPALTYRAIGGIVDMHFFLGPNPEDLNKQYLNMIGFPVFPPYWALGFQLSRWGYTDTEEIRDLVNRTRAANIPQDVQVFDIDYMDRYKDFTVDPVNFGDIANLTQELHDMGIKVIMMLDPAIVVDLSYTPYVTGRAQDVFIKWNDPSLIPTDQLTDADDYIVGYVWPDEKTVYPDFMKPETEQWWENNIVDFYNNYIQFDGLWIDMNEPACFGTDTPHPWNWPEGEPDWSLKCPYNKLDSPPYPTKTTYSGSTESFRISDHTICLSSSQFNGTTTYSSYDTHSLYGWSQSVQSYRILENLLPGKRPLLLSRSTFVGSGNYAVHWLGDNTANSDSLRMAIIGMIEFSMFGISFTGADICGFFGEPSMELCLRWTQVGAFYPFSRNHNAKGNNPQDPAIWPEVSAAAQKYYNLRYQYIPYLYYLHYQASVTGSTVVRPFYNVFPTDSGSRGIKDQFFWADGIMVAPVVEFESGDFTSKTTRDIYFPPGTYYDLMTGALVATGPITLSNVDVPLDVLPVYVRGGVILPYQEPALTTTLSRQNPFGLTIAIEDGAASGAIFWDDGASAYGDPIGNAFEASVTYSSDPDILSVTVDHDPELVTGLSIETLQFFGYPAIPTGISVNAAPINSSAWNYDNTTQVLVVSISEPLGADLAVVIVS